MTGFRELLRTQRWDDHRYYHHSLMNQALHLLSAATFVLAYAYAFVDPAISALVGWLVSMTSRQIGHLVFEPRDYDVANQATHEHKEEIKVGYNLRRKIVLMAIWAASPLAFALSPTLFGLCRPAHSALGVARHVGNLWLAVAGGGLLVRVVQLALTQSMTTGLVWATKILTDPFHDIMLYHRAPLRLWQGTPAGEDVPEHARPAASLPR